MATKKPTKADAQRARNRKAKADTADANRYFEALAKKRRKSK